MEHKLATLYMYTGTRKLKVAEPRFQDTIRSSVLPTRKRNLKPNKLNGGSPYLANKQSYRHEAGKLGHSNTKRCTRACFNQYKDKWKLLNKKLLPNWPQIWAKTRSTMLGMLGVILWWVHLALGTETLLSISMSVQCTLYFRIRSPFYGQLFAVTGVCPSRSVPHQNWFLKPSVPDLQILIHP